MHSIVVYASRLLRCKICTKPAGRVHASRDGLLVIYTTTESSERVRSVVEDIQKLVSGR